MSLEPSPLELVAEALTEMGRQLGRIADAMEGGGADSCSVKWCQRPADGPDGLCLIHAHRQEQQP